MDKRKHVWLFWVLAFAGAFAVLSQVGYSDGDDAYFYQHAHDMGFVQYIGMRYEQWVGRIAGEALVYLTFRMGLWFWRTVNALMLILLPMGILRLAACVGRGERKTGIMAAVAAVSGYLMMDAMTLGYAAVWVNGSVFYTWTFTCGIWALLPVARCVFAWENSGREEACGLHIQGKIAGWQSFLYAIPCAVTASMSIEQMGAVLLVFELLALLYCVWRQHRIPVLLAVQTFCSAAAYAILFAAPGNAIRSAQEVATWMPEYATMSFGQHLFITAQWLLSSFANENRLFLCGIWLAGVLLLRQKRQREQSQAKYAAPQYMWSSAIWEGAAVLFAVAAFLPYFGITVCSDLGMDLPDITERIDRVPAFLDLTGGNLFAICWWVLALVFTFAFLWKVSEFDVTLLLVYLAGIASEAILFFSPTMYASGARVYYLTDLLYLFLVLCLSLRIEKRMRNRLYAMIIALGICNLAFQLPVFLAHL